MDYLVPKFGDYVALVGCSDPLDRSRKHREIMLIRYLSDSGLIPVVSPILYNRSATARERAGVLMDMYTDNSIRAIFDISGGDLALGVLEHLDIDAIAGNPKPIWGYSDLTCVLNGVYEATGQRQVLYQVMNLERDSGGMQARSFQAMMRGDRGLMRPQWTMHRGRSICGTVVGGNFRCLLKLSGTYFMPKMDGRVLFLESYGGGAERIRSMLEQLRLQGTTDKLSGLLLGTFTQLEQEIGRCETIELIMDTVGRTDLPIAVTDQVGHAATSKALVIGEKINIQE